MRFLVFTCILFFYSSCVANAEDNIFEIAERLCSSRNEGTKIDFNGSTGGNYEVGGKKVYNIINIRGNIDGYIAMEDDKYEYVGPKTGEEHNNCVKLILDHASLLKKN